MDVTLATLWEINTTSILIAHSTTDNAFNPPIILALKPLHFLPDVVAIAS